MPLSSRPLAPGEVFNQVVSKGQAFPGRFGTFDSIPSQSFARTDLAILSEWKDDVSLVQQWQAPMDGPAIWIQEGTVGPQTELDGTVMPGGASQLEILNPGSRLMPRDLSRLIKVGDPVELPEG